MRIHFIFLKHVFCPFLQAVVRALEDLAENGKIKEKIYGKQKVYFADQVVGIKFGWELVKWFLLRPGRLVEFTTRLVVPQIVVTLTLVTPNFPKMHCIRCSSQAQYSKIWAERIEGCVNDVKKVLVNCIDMNSCERHIGSPSR